MATSLRNGFPGPASAARYAKIACKVLRQIICKVTALENAQLASAVAQEAAQRERLHRELEIAREVQTRLLPKHEPVIPGLETAGLCRPAQSIGGDYYDYPVLPNGSFALAIGDVAGKGVPAALLMSNLQAALRGMTASSTPANRFITFLYSVYEPATRRWTCCTAGHNPAALLRARQHGGGVAAHQGPGPEPEAQRPL